MYPEAPEKTFESVLLARLNPQQQEAVMAPLQGAIRVMAGAGTGKTELITRRFAKLVMDLQAEQVDHPTGKIWVSTFTDKAAQEMKSRITDYVLKASDISLDPHAWIGTFHSLCQRILQQHKNKRPYLKQYTLLTDAEQELFIEEMIQAVLSCNPPALKEALAHAGLPHLETVLSLPQWQALSMQQYDDLIEEIITTLIPQIKASGLSPKGFYQLAKQQSAEVTQLIRTLPVSDGYGGGMWEEHESYARHWQKHLEPVSYSGFSFAPTDWEVELAAEKSHRQQKDPISPDKLCLKKLKLLYDTHYFVSYDGRKKKAPFSPATRDLSDLDAAVQLETRLIDILAAIYALYQYQLRVLNAFDFDDLIQETIQLLEDFPEVRSDYQETFAHFMVDEFQDSNGSQLRLIELLCGKQDPKLTVVGDKKQSIYGFRFAEPENLELLFSDTPDVKTIPLQTNYRSVSPILALANRVTEMMNLPASETLIHPIGEAPDTNNAVQWLHLEEATSVGEARAIESLWIAETIADLIHQGIYEPKDIAVLVRSNPRVGQIEALLDDLGIPSIKQKNLGFFDSPVIQQAVALLQLAENNNDDFAMINLLQRKLNHQQLYLLSNIRKDLIPAMGDNHISYYEALCHVVQDPENAPEALIPCVPLFEMMVSQLHAFETAKLTLPPHLLFNALLQAFPLIQTADLVTLKGQKTYQQLERLKQMLYYWTAHAKSSLSLRQILDYIERSQAKNELKFPVQDDDFQENAVKLMTLHGAKGLQFPVVFLAGVEESSNKGEKGKIAIDSQYPGKMGFGLLVNKVDEEKSLKRLVYETVWKKPREQAEALRLLYVGITRAESRLYLSSWPKSFPYLNPAFFQDLPVLRLEDSDLTFKTPTEKAAVLEEMKGRYWQVPDEALENELADFQSLLAKSTQPVSKASIMLLEMESLVAFDRCPTRGIMHHQHFNGNSTAPSRMNVQGHWIDDTLAIAIPMESIKVPQENAPVTTAVQQASQLTFFQEASSEPLSVPLSARQSRLSDGPFGEGDYKILQMPLGDLTELALRFRQMLSEEMPYVAPDSDIHCPNCPYLKRCPHVS